MEGRYFLLRWYESLSGIAEIAVIIINEIGVCKCLQRPLTAQRTGTVIKIMLFG